MLPKQQQRLFDMFKKRKWVAPSDFNYGWRFSQYIMDLKKKGFKFEERWIDTETKKKHYKEFKLIHIPKVI